MTTAERQRLLEVARGDAPADLVLRNGRVLNVFTGQIQAVDIAVCGSWIAGLGVYRGPVELDLDGALVLPSFIDSHVHIESSMVTPPEYARAVVPHGTTAVVADPHEIANVLGRDGVQFMLEAAKGLPLDIHLMASPCVPATHMETSGAVLSPADIRTLLATPGIHGLAEVMNFPGVIQGSEDMLAKIAAAEGRVRDGHAPGVRGKSIQAYFAAGIGSDHECTTPEEAREKVAAGAFVMIREGTAAKNLEALLPAVTAENHHRFLFCTDDRHPGDLLGEGHIDYLVRRAIELGLPPLQAVRMATLNAAQYFGFDRRGAIAPGWQADLLVCDSFESLAVQQVYKAGKLVARDGALRADVPAPPEIGPAKFQCPRLSNHHFEVEAAGESMRVIVAYDGQIVTGAEDRPPIVWDGLVLADPAQDLAKLAVIERHRGTGAIGLGFVTGLGLQRGAIASSVAHDSHNLVIAGMADADMAVAGNRVRELNGGLVAVVDGTILAELPLPVAGLISDQPLPLVQAAIEELAAAVQQIGTTVTDPFMLLSFLALPVIPSLKLTDQGVVDVEAFKLVDLFQSQ